MAFGHDYCRRGKQLWLLLSAVGRTWSAQHRKVIFLEQLLLQNGGLVHSYRVLITSHSIRIWSLYLLLLTILPLLRNRLVVAGRAAKVSEIYSKLVAIILQDQWPLDGACVVCKHISLVSGISLSVHNMWEVVFSALLARVQAVIHVLSGSTQAVDHADFVVLHRDGGGHILEVMETQQRLARGGAVVEAAST